MKRIYIKLYPMSRQIYRLILLSVCILITFSGCNSMRRNRINDDLLQGNEQPSTQNSRETSLPEESVPTISPFKEAIADPISSEVYSFIDETGTTLDTRILTPKGYTRIPSVAEEFTGFIRALPLKEDGSDVFLYNGLPKNNQDGHIAVFDLTLGDRDLQQCADSLIRIYAEYYWSIHAYDKIAFHLTNGFLMEYTKWREGNRLIVDGNEVRWSKDKDYNDSYKEFQNYLTMVFVYAGTLSLAEECSEISLEELLPGDMFLQGGSPGHCVMVIDIAQDKEGDRCFLLAQGYMPAQDFHILKNPLHPEDPWFYVQEVAYPLKTPSWQFKNGSLVRWRSFPLNEAS